MQITRPHISEKTLMLASKGWYTFATSLSNRKETIAQEIEKMFNVTVINIRSLHMHGKVRKVGRRMKVKHRPDWKKIIVQLKAGQKIDAFEVTQQGEQSEKPVKGGSTSGK